MTDALDGISILVTFDAGGMGSSVNPNPHSFTLIDDDSFAVEWQLDRSLNTGAGYLAAIGNIVPCHDQDIRETLAGYTFVSEQVPSQGPATGWRWTFTRDPAARPAPPAPKELLGEIKYEIFFSYGPDFQNLAHPSQRRIVSLRQSAAVDPSLILPPKQSGPGLPAGSTKTVRGRRAPAGRSRGGRKAGRTRATGTTPGPAPAASPSRPG